MNENLDLTKILKNCPKGTKFYSPVWGEVSFYKIHEEELYIIEISTINGYKYLTKEGYYINVDDAECILFPSKEQRDWSKFTAPWYKKEKFDPKTLQPFDKVLVRNMDSDDWSCAFFSHITVFDETVYRCTTEKTLYEKCIPYNDKTKYLVGTNDEAPEYYRYWED